MDTHQCHGRRQVCPQKKNTSFGLKENSSCSESGPHFVTCDGARLFYTSKEIRNQEQSSLRKRHVGGNHSCFTSNTVRFRALFMWGNSALTSLTGNQKNPYSMRSDLHNVCYSLGRIFITQNSNCLLRDTFVCFLGCPRQPQSSSTWASKSFS